MTDLKKEFYDYLNQEVKEIDFQKLFKDIKDNNVYSPDKLEEAVFITLYRVLGSKSHKLCEKYVMCLNNIIEILRNKEQKTTKLQLLSIVSECSNINKEVNTKCNSEDELHGLYS